MIDTSKDAIRKMLNTLDDDLVEKVFNFIDKVEDKYVPLIFMPVGESHHDANKCPYCKENLNART